MKTKPGPGLYSPKKPETQIHFSMRKKLNQSEDKRTPGPGNYNDDRELYYSKIPGTGSKMGKDMRKSDHFLHNSSYKKQEPGRYNLHDFAGNEYMGVPKFSFGNDSRMKDRVNNLPGPQSYPIKTKMTDGVPKYSMPGRRKDLRPKVGVGVPGAGNYDPMLNYSKKNGPQFSVGKSRRDGEVNIFNKLEEEL